MKKFIIKASLKGEPGGLAPNGTHTWVRLLFVVAASRSARLCIRKLKQYFKGVRRLFYFAASMHFFHHLQQILKYGGSGNIKVLGTRIYDLRSNEISLSCEEMADQMMGKGIHITF